METSNPNSSEQNTGAAAESSPESERPFDKLASALRAGAADARRAGEQAIPRVKAAAAEAAYWMAYGVTFAAVFEWTLLKNLTPESMKTGIRDGVKGGKEAAQEWLDQAQRDERSAEPVALLGSATPDSQPGSA